MLLALRSPRFGGTLLYAVSLLALGLLPPGDLAASPPTAGLVGYWPFDGSFDDASGNGNHASNQGASLVPDRFGRPDRAVEVGLGRYLRVADSPSLALTQAFSVAVWIRRDAANYAFAAFVGKDYNTAFAVGVYSNSDQCPDPDAYRPVVVKVGDRSGYFDNASFDCATGEWRHVAVTYDGAAGEMRLYVDGVPVETRSHHGTLAVSTSPLGIGRDGRWNDCFEGLLDEIYLYDRVLSETEVAALVSDGTVTPTVENPGAFAYVVAASAHAPGLNLTSWRSDLVLHNPGNDDATADLFFLESRADNGDAEPYRVTVPASASLLIADVVASLFTRDGVTGAVLVGSDRPLTVSSRTFNDASTGTYGQSIPGVATTAAWGGDANLPRLVQLAHSPDDDSGFRTNVGAVNLRGTPLVLDLELHTGSGEPLGALQLEVPPYGHVQRSNVFGAVTTERLDDAFARVVAATAGGRYLVYASVVDNRSGDPVFVPGR